MSTPSPNADHGAPAVDRREAPRRQKHIKVLVSASADARTPVPGWVLDRSLGGLCLSVPEEVPPGSVLGVRSAAEPEAGWVEVEVKNCRHVEDAWELHCQFAQPPSHAVLMMFS
jgi:hypothetical protein